MALAPLSLLAPFPVSTALGLAANKARKAQYDNYINNFNQGFITPSSSYGITSSQSDQKITDTKATAETGESSFVETEAERAKRMAAISRRNEALKGKRSFFSGVKQTIAGQL